MKLLAQQIQVIPSVGAGTPQPPAFSLRGPLEGITTVSGLLNTLISFLIPFGAFVLFLVIVWGGFDYLTSQGNPDKIKSAKAKLTTGIIGFVLLVSSYVIVRLITSIFGIGGDLF